MENVTNITNRTADNSTISPDHEGESAWVISVILLILFCLAVATTVTNGLFLWTFYKDPLKCLRTPSAIFIAGLTSANFLTGVIAEPAMIITILLRGNADLSWFSRFSEAFGFVTMTSSFLIMLALGIVQYLLIERPVLYQKAVSPKSAVIGVICVFIYSIFFATLPDIADMAVVDKAYYYIYDLSIHNALLTIVLMILYIRIYFAFCSLATRHLTAEFHQTRTEGEEPTIEQTKSEQQRHRAQKDFVYGTIMLTIVLIVTVWPLCICMFIFMFSGPIDGIYLALLLSYLFFLWKFTLDPFLFAWRLRKYRKALMLIVQGACPCCKPSSPKATYRKEGVGLDVPHSETDDDGCKVLTTVIDSGHSTQEQTANT